MHQPLLPTPSQCPQSFCLALDLPAGVLGPWKNRKERCSTSCLFPSDAPRHLEAHTSHLRGSWPNSPPDSTQEPLLYSQNRRLPPLASLPSPGTPLTGPWQAPHSLNPRFPFALIAADSAHAKHLLASVKGRALLYPGRCRARLSGIQSWVQM